MTSRTGSTAPCRRRRALRTGCSGPQVQPAGFTLLELLLVVTLLGLLFGIAIPRFRGAHEAARLEAAGEIVKRSIQAARSGARTSGTTWALDWDPGAHQINVQPLTLAASAVGSGADQRVEIVFRPRDLPREFLIRWSDYHVIFYPDGRAEPAWVEIESRRGTRLRMEIEEYGTRISGN